MREENLSVTSLKSSPIVNSRTNTSDFPIICAAVRKVLSEDLYAGATSLIGWKSRATCFCCRNFVSLIFRYLIFRYRKRSFRTIFWRLTTSETWNFNNNLKLFFEFLFSFLFSWHFSVLFLSTEIFQLSINSDKYFR